MRLLHPIIHMLKNELLHEKLKLKYKNSSIQITDNNIGSCGINSFTTTRDCSIPITEDNKSIYKLLQHTKENQKNPQFQNWRKNLQT